MMSFDLSVFFMLVICLFGIGLAGQLSFTISMGRELRTEMNELRSELRELRGNLVEAASLVGAAHKRLSQIEGRMQGVSKRLDGIRHVMLPNEFDARKQAAGMAPFLLDDHDGDEEADARVYAEEVMRAIVPPLYRDNVTFRCVTKVGEPFGQWIWTYTPKLG